MKPLSIVLALSNAQNSETLAKSLHHHFRVVNAAGNLDELRHAIPKHRADVAVVDLEMAALAEVGQLKRDFPATRFICTHRLADEQMWTAALSAGASDCCYASDVRAIVLAASDMRPRSHAHAA